VVESPENEPPPFPYPFRDAFPQRKGHRGGEKPIVIRKESLLAKQMAVCAGCGREFESKPENPAHGGIAYLVKLPLRGLFLALAALFLIGGFILIGMNVGTALADQDFSLPTLSLLAIFVVIFVLMVLMYRNLRRSRELFRYCPDCAVRY